MEASGLRLLTREGNDMLTRPNLSGGIKRSLAGIKHVLQVIQKRVAPNTVLDFELVGPRGKHQTEIFLLDCLAHDGKWLAETAYSKRWAICKSIGETLSAHDGIHLAHTIKTGFITEFERLKAEWEKEKAQGRDLHLTEGIVLKRTSGKMMLKLSESAKSKHSFRLKFRDVADKRF